MDHIHSNLSDLGRCTFIFLQRGKKRPVGSCTESGQIMELSAHIVHVQLK
jgi:hypothetical protein